MKTKHFLLTVILIFLSSYANAQSRYIVELFNVKGNVLLTHGKDVEKAENMTKVQKDDLLEVKKGASVDILFNTGAKFHLGEGCKVRVTASNLKSDRFHPLPVPLSPLKISLGNGLDKTGTAFGIINRDNTFPMDANLSPFGAVTQLPIELKWDKGDGDVLLRIAEYRDGKLYGMSVRTLKAGTANFTIDENTYRLKKGVWYTWAVQDKRADAPVHRSWIRIPSVQDTDLIERCRISLPEAEKTAKNGDCTSLLVTGEIFESIGRFDLAANAYSLASKYLPNDTGVDNAIKRTRQVLK